MRTFLSYISGITGCAILLFSGAWAQAQTSVSTRSTDQLQVEFKEATHSFADWIGLGFDSVWLPLRSIRLMERRDLSGNLITTIPIGNVACRGVGIGNGSGYESKYVWMVSCQDKSLRRINPQTNKVEKIGHFSIDPKQTEGSIAVGEGAIWVIGTGADASTYVLDRIDPVSLQVVAQIPMGSSPAGVALGFGSVWVTDTKDGTLTEVDPVHNTIVGTPFTVGSQPRFLVTGEGAVWVMNQGDGTLVRVEPSTRQLTSIAVNAVGPGGDVAVGQGYVWVTNKSAPVIQVDPKTNSVVQRFEGNLQGDEIKVSSDAVWFTQWQGTLWKIKL